MKENKICINKGLMVVAIIAMLVLGVVALTNYVNTQNLSSSSRASAPMGPCEELGGTCKVGGCPTGSIEGLKNTCPVSQKCCMAKIVTASVTSGAPWIQNVWGTGFIAANYALIKFEGGLYLLRDKADIEFHSCQKVPATVPTNNKPWQLIQGNESLLTNLKIIQADKVKFFEHLGMLEKVEECGGVKYTGSANGGTGSNGSNGSSSSYGSTGSSSSSDSSCHPTPIQNQEMHHLSVTPIQNQEGQD